MKNRAKHTKAKLSSSCFPGKEGPADRRYRSLNSLFPTTQEYEPRAFVARRAGPFWDTCNSKSSPCNSICLNYRYHRLFSFSFPHQVETQVVHECFVFSLSQSSANECDLQWTVKVLLLLSSLRPDTSVKCICRNINCAQGKWRLHSRWNFPSTFTELHVHGDERWPTEVTSNTYFRGVWEPGREVMGPAPGAREQLTLWTKDTSAQWIMVEGHSQILRWQASHAVKWVATLSR